MPIEGMSEGPDATESTVAAAMRPKVQIDARRCLRSLEDPDAYWVAVCGPTMEDAGSTESKTAALEFAARKYGGYVAWSAQFGPHADDGRTVPPDADDGRVRNFASGEAPNTESEWRQMAARQNMSKPTGRTSGFVTFHKIRRPDSVIK